MNVIFKRGNTKTLYMNKNGIAVKVLINIILYIADISTPIDNRNMY